MRVAYEPTVALRLDRLGCALGVKLLLAVSGAVAFMPFSRSSPMILLSSGGERDGVVDSGRVSCSSVCSEVTGVSICSSSSATVSYVNHKKPHLSFGRQVAYVVLTSRSIEPNRT